MKSRSGSRFSAIGKIVIATALLALAACESKSSTTTAVEATTTTSTTSTTTTVPAVTNNSGGFMVGDEGPGGGLVIYTSETSFACGVDLKSMCNAIESAPKNWHKNLNLPTGCGGLQGIDPSCKWDNGGSAFADKTFLDGPGAGEVNTSFMMAAGSPVAKLVTSYRGGNFENWYVPTRVETMLQCYRAYDLDGSKTDQNCAGRFNNSYIQAMYWTSMRLDDRHAALVSFDNGKKYSWDSQGYAAVRPVRSFRAILKSESTTTTRPKATTTTVGVKCGQTGVTCKVGDTTVNGGKVFYVSSAGFSCGATMSNTCHYLEVADASWHLLVQSPCVPSGSYSVLCPWGASSETYVENDSRIGGGLKSSIAVSAANGNTGGFAAMQAMGFRAGGKSDWYLPNLDELRELCKYANNQPTGTEARCTAGTLRSDFVSEAYWSSTDSGLSRVNVINFGDPVGGASVAKNGTAQTRPIRAF